jgi:glycerophosphoryl diester phosphodiesterase
VVLVLRGDGRCIRIGHRGAAAVAPENTLRGLVAAVEAGVDIVELDVLAVGGKLVLGHSLRELPDEPASFDDALAALAEAGVGVHVDVKSKGSEEAIVDAIRRHGVADRAYVSAPWPKTLRRFAELAPGLPRALSYPEDRAELSRRRGLGWLTVVGPAALRVALPRRIVGMLSSAGATLASLHHGVVSPDTIERCHAAGFPVLVWTVDDPALIRRLDELGVDAIVSNDPKMLGATLASR